MSPVNEIRDDEILADIQAGAMDTELMEKYNLSAKELRSSFQRLTDSGRLEVSEICHSPVFWDETIDCESRRGYPRLLLAFVQRIHEEECPEKQGLVIDVTEKGMQVKGIAGTLGEVRTFQVVPRRFTGVAAFRFTAECVWNCTDPTDAQPLLGLRVAEISAEDKGRLRAFIRFITLGK
ncbi:MAG: hypothetical protein HY914_03680 [Desulfomonile tiedjei]|nr:hypothetical protein [Desulfomonile tiedjei]